ncbi:MAG: hypothetical protein AAF800_11230 [Planctomycetota bacterium]
MALKVTFSGPSPATNALSPGGGGTYFGSAPDFTIVAVAINGGMYTMTVLNYGGVSGWPAVFTMAKADGNNTDVIGRYEQTGGTGVAIVSP